MARQTLEQQRALYALRVIQEREASTDEYNKRKYGTLVRSLSSMVLQNGLGQALAYLLADAEGKGPREKPARALYDELQDWLCGAGVERPERVYPEGGDLIAGLMAGSRTEYMQAQQTALALLGWMRKFADAYLPKEQ